MNFCPSCGYSLQMNINKTSESNLQKNSSANREQATQETSEGNSKKRKKS